MAEVATKRRPRATRTSDGAVVKDQVAVADIVLDSDVQPRENISAALIGEYAEAMREGAEFPEIVVYRDPETGVLIAADGWHRVMAAKEADRATIAAEVRPGTKRDAILYSVAANATHGLRRTNDDKRRAVFRLMDDEEWGLWSDNIIAAKVGVSQPFVSSLRKKRNRDGEGEGRRVVTTVDGSEMDVSNIGRTRRRGAETEDEDETEVTATEPTATNGHAPVALVPDDDEDDEDDGIGTGALDAGEITVETFAQRMAEMLLQLGDFEPDEVFAAMDTGLRDQLADKWDDIIGQFDGYSEALEKALSS